MPQPIAEPEFVVAEDDPPGVRCPHCNRPFRNEHLYRLHLGEIHPDVCSEEELKAYEEAYEAESRDLFTFHAKVVVALLLVFFAITYTYAITWH